MVGALANVRGALGSMAASRRGVNPACGDNRACDLIPVPQRMASDFLWQRSPFQLSGGAATIETAGVDYLLPYWMARYYGVSVDRTPPNRIASAGPHPRPLCHNKME